MSDHIKNLYEQRNAAWEEAKALLDTAEAEKRDFDAEESAKWERINEDINAKDARIQELRSIEEREERAAEARAAYEHIARPVQEEKRDTSVSDFLRGNAEAREMHIPGTYEARDLTVGSAAAGGNTVPTDFYGVLVATLQESTGVLRANPTIITTDGGANFEVPTVTGYTAVAQVDETSAVGSETDPGFGKATLTAYKFMGFVQASSELVADNGVNIESYLGRMLGEQVARGLDKQLAEGDGSTEPQGIFTGFSNSVTAASASITIDNLIDLTYGVYDGYRPGSYFVMKDSTVNTIRKLKDDNNNYLWQPSNIVGQPDTLLGYPVVSDAFAPAIGTGLKSVAFGNLNRGFMVRIVNGINVQRSDDFAFSTDLVSWRAVLRADSAVVDSNAVKLLVHA